MATPDEMLDKFCKSYYGTWKIIECVSLTSGNVETTGIEGCEFILSDGGDVMWKEDTSDVLPFFTLETYEVATVEPCVLKIFGTFSGHSLEFKIAGVHPRTVQTRLDGSLDMTDLRRKIRVTDNVHQPLTKLICAENTHNMRGGKVLHPEYLESLSELAREHELAVHCDGARIMNAAVALNRRVSELLNFCDSVSVCLSKGLGAPVGSVIAGSGKFVESSQRIRKSLGGGLKQCGILAAAGLMALNEAEKTLSVDHENAQVLANCIKKLDSPLLRIKPEDVHTNILVVDLPNKERLSANMFCDKLQQVGGEEFVSVLALPAALPSQVRLVTHKDVSREDVEMAADKIQRVLEQIF